MLYINNFYKGCKYKRPLKHSVINNIPPEHTLSILKQLPQNFNKFDFCNEYGLYLKYLKSQASSVRKMSGRTSVYEIDFGTF